MNTFYCQLCQCLFRIEISKNDGPTKVLGVSSNGDVEKQEQVESFSQIWTKVKENAEGYFFLKNMRNPTSSELLTAVSESDLKVEGNYTTM